MIALFCLCLALFVSPFKSKSRLEAENVALRHQPWTCLSNHWLRPVLYVLVIVRLERRQLVWINVTPLPTAEWIARQVTEAFPWDEAPRYLIRDRDRAYGAAFTHRLRASGIRDKPIAPGSPWQNGFAERLIGSIRRECVDHIVVPGEAHLRRILTKYSAYYNELRTHRSLGKERSNPSCHPARRPHRIAAGRR
ncbi:MAG: integrase core domain-containing protein [Xanthobacteraceae bacterium]